jgi:pyruvate dehydrogenase E2 component (dihydrolipoamide acetyltransferase)
MAHEVTMPQMGYDMTEGTINEWRVKEGDPVSRGDTIASIATDKADIDIEAYADGVLRKIVVQPGQTVAVGTVIAWIGDADEDVPESAEPGKAAAASRAESPSGAAAGQLTEDRGTGGGVAPAEEKQESAPPPPKDEAGDGGGTAAKSGGELAVPEQGSAAAPAIEGDVDTAPGGNGRVKASPYARKRAAELGVDLAGVRGSGPGGRIVAQDVEKALEAGAKPAKDKAEAQEQPEPRAEQPKAESDAEQPESEAAPPEKSAAKPQQAAAAAAKAPQPAPVSAGDDPYSDTEPSRLRRALARAMVEAKTTVPHFYLTVDVDAEPLLRLRAEVNQLGPESPKLSVTDLIVRACAMTLQSHPQLNAAWIDGTMRRFERSNVSVAVALSDGLIAPTLRNLDGISMRELAERLHDLVARAKSNRLRQEELSGGHMAVSNLGMFGIEEFAAIITPPQSAVLAVGAVRDTPVVVDGAVKPGKRMRMTLAVDHRVTDGAQGAEALDRVKWLLEHPAALLV